MRYREVAPQSLAQGDAAQKAASGYVESYWTFSTDASDAELTPHIIPPDGAVAISAARAPSGAVMVKLARPPTTAQQIVVPRGASFAGARLMPGLAGSLLGVDIDQLADGIVDLEEVAPGALASPMIPANAPLLDHIAALIAQLAARAHPKDQAIADAARTILRANGDVEIDAVVRASGLSESQFRRRFKSAAGLSPKEFARLRRVRQACIELVSRKRSLAAAAAEAGFADQPHFSREFRAVFGGKPALIRDYLLQIEHAGLIEQSGSGDLA